MAQLNADLSNYDTQEGFDVLEPGWYEAVVSDSEIKDGKNGSYIQWTWEVVGKPNRLWDYMSLGNEVAMQRLKTMAACCGHSNSNFLADTEELHGKKCLLRLKIQKDEGYEPKNKITSFKPIEKSTTPQPPPVEKPTAQPQQKMPWE